MTKSMKKHIAVLLTVITALFFLAGCSSTPTPTETADAFLQALKSQDTEALAEVYAGSELDLLEAASESNEESDEAEDSEDTVAGMETVYEEQMLPKMLEFDYELSNEQIDGDKATVDVKVTTYRFGDAFTAFYSDFISQAFVLAFSDTSDEEFDALAVTILSGKLADLTEKSYEKTAPLTLTMKDDKWVVDELEEGSDIVDALTGGLVTAMNTMSDALSAWDEEE